MKAKIKKCIGRYDYKIKNKRLLKKMETKIKRYVERYDYKFIKIKNKESIKRIYDFYFSNVNQIEDISLSDCSELELLYYGVYSYVNKNYCDMMGYYEMAIEKGNIDAMYLLGYYYETRGDYENMIEWYLMAIENGDDKILFNGY